MERVALILQVFSLNPNLKPKITQMLTGSRETREKREKAQWLQTGRTSPGPQRREAVYSQGSA